VVCEGEEGRRRRRRRRRRGERKGMEEKVKG
jgi:hypothetical protein